MGSAPGLSRRAFLSGKSRSAPAPLRPPWSDETSILDACTACGACIEACPQGILSAGPDARPLLSFSNDECTFCGACAEACPEPVFDRDRRPAFAHAVRIGDACFAAKDIHCQSCGDTCPELAIRFRPRRGGPPLPELNPESCTGCGACVAACPADAISVIPLEGAYG